VATLPTLWWLKTNRSYKHSHLPSHYSRVWQCTALLERSQVLSVCPEYEDEYETSVNWQWQGKKQTLISVTSFTMNPTSTGLGSNPGLRCKRPLINPLNHGTILKAKSLLSFSEMQQPNSGLAVPLLRFLDHTHTHKHTYSASITSLSEWTARHRGRYLHNRHNTRITMPSAGFEPAILAIERPQTCASDHTAIGTGIINLYYT
jgi:hypothetical protein